MTAELITQLITVISSFGAIFVAWQANKIARVSHLQIQEATRQAARAQDRHNELVLLHRQQVADLESRRRVASVSAWWVIFRRAGEDNSNDSWGIVISNQGPNAGMLYDVTVQATTGNATKPDLTFEHLPPGQYFSESSHSGWEFPEPVHPRHHYDPVMKSRKHQVVRMDFADPLGDRWQWTPQTGVQCVAEQ